MKRHALPLLLWTAAVALFFAPLLLGTARLPNGDFAGQFHAFAQFQAREFAAGRLPLWSPGSYGGFPFAADTQAAVFYPLRWLFLLFTLPSGHFPYSLLQLEALLHIWLGGLFTYLLTHDILTNLTINNSAPSKDETGGKHHNNPRQESHPRLSRPNHPIYHLPSIINHLSFFSALAFTLGGYLTSYPILQLAILETIIWLPLTLWLLRRAILHAKKPFATLLLAGLTLGLAALAGHPQTLLHSGYLALAYFLFLTWRARWPWRQRLLGLVTWGTAVIGISAAGWLPTLIYLQNATRSDVSYEFVSTGLPLLNYLQAFAPRALTQWSPEFVGLTTLLLVLLAWQFRKQAAGEIHFWAATAVFAAWLSLGDKGILFEAAYYGLPGFSLFRQQERLVSLVSLALALLAAQGLALWWQHGTSTNLRRAGLWLAALWLTAGLILTATHPITTDGWHLNWLYSGGLALLAWLALSWSQKTRRITENTGEKEDKESPLSQKSSPRPPRSPRLIPLLLLLLLFLELWFGTRSAIGWVNGSPSDFWPQPDWVTAVLQQDDRFDSSLLILANGGEIFGYEDIRGISPLKLQAVAAYEELPRPLRWQLLNVTHVLAWDAIEPQLEPLMPADTHIFPGETLNQTLYRFTDPLPRARMIYDIRRVPDQAAALAALQQPEFDPRQQLILEEPPTVLYDDRQRDPQPVVNARRLSPTRYEIDVQTAVPGYLLLSEWYYPGWQARSTSGIRYPIERANGGQQAIFIPGPADITILLDYRPFHIYLGLTLTAVSLLAILITTFFSPLTVDNWLLTIDHLSKGGETGGKKPNSHQANNSRLSRPDLHPRLSFIIYHLPFLLLSAALRLFRLGHQELRGDEAFSFLYARRDLLDIIPALIREGDPHSPLHYLTMHGWMQLAGDSEFAMRYLSAMAAVLAVPLMMLLARRLFGRGRVVWLVGGLTAVSPLLIWLAQEVRNQYSFAILWTLAATLIVISIHYSVASFQSLNRLPNTEYRIPSHWLLYTLAATLAVYSHYYAIFALLAHPLLWLGNPQLNRRQQWRLTRGWLLSGLATLLLFLPWGLAVLSELLRAGQLSDPDTPELARYLVRITRELLIGASLPGRWVRWLLLGCAAAVFTVLYSVFSKKDTKQHIPNTEHRLPTTVSLRFLLAWLLLATLAIYLIRFTRATFNPFYISVAAPPALLLLAFTLSRLLARPKRNLSFFIYRLSFFILLFATLLSLQNHYLNPAFSKTQGYRAVAAEVITNRIPNDRFISNFPDPALDYYFRVPNIIPLMQPSTFDATAVSTATELTQLANQHDQLWFVPATGWDNEQHASSWLNSNLILTHRSQHDSLTLLGYCPRRTAQLQPRSDLFNSEIELTGVHLLQNGRSLPPNAPLTLQPNDELAVTLVWQAKTAVSDHYTVFVQLLDQNGLLLTQHDSVPQSGQRPTNSWQAGDTIIDRHVLPLPPNADPTSAQLIVGLYQTATVERLLTQDNRDFTDITP